MNLSQISAFVFDLDGVIWRGQSAIAGAAPSLKWLRARGKRCAFASNNSTRAPAQFAEKLAQMGIEAAPAEVVTSTSATIAYLRAHFARGARVGIVGEAGLRAQLENGGFDVVEATGAVEAVVAGLARAFTYADLARAQRQILDGAAFIATNRDATFPVEDGVKPGAGAIVAAIETASGRAPLTMGKPEPAMLLQVMRDFGLEAHQIALIGDRLDTDIACAHRAGMGAIWVATGVNSWEQARAAQGEQKPDLLLEDLPALVEMLEG